jgi:chromosome partitioning protein
VIDTAPGLPGVTRSALLASEVALIPLAPALVDLDRLAPTLELLAELDGTHQLAVRLLLTRVRVRTRMAAGARVVLENLGMPILDAEIPLREAFAMAFGSRPALIGEYLSVVQELRTATRRVAA